MQGFWIGEMRLFDVVTIDREMWDKIGIRGSDVVSTERKYWTKIWIHYRWVLRVPGDRMWVTDN